MAVVQTVYYVAAAIVAIIAIGGFIFSKYRTGRDKISNAVGKIESIESSVDEMKQSQEEIRKQQEKADQRQEELVAALVAVTQDPERVDPNAIEDRLTEDTTRPSPSDFYNGTGVDFTGGPDPMD